MEISTLLRPKPLFCGRTALLYTVLSVIKLVCVFFLEEATRFTSKLSQNILKIPFFNVFHDVVGEKQTGLKSPNN